MKEQTTNNQAWIFAEVPSPKITRETIELKEITTPQLEDLQEGDVLIKTTFLSVDPYMRLAMTPSSDLPVPAFEIGKPLSGGGTAVVVASRNPGFAAGDNVTGQIPWKRINLVKGAEGLNRIPVSEMSPSHYLGTLGLTGITAWLGLETVAEPKEGETIFISGASGAVGIVVGQLAKNAGLKVLGSAGSDKKVAYLKSIGFDGAFNYKSTKVRDALIKLAPKGLDIFWDNVGGEFSRAALQNLKEFGRVVQVGSISEYNSNNEEVTGPELDLVSIALKRLRIQGFVAVDHLDRFGEVATELAGLIQQGKLRSIETVIDGFENMNEALVRLFSGDHNGKLVVKTA